MQGMRASLLVVGIVLVVRKRSMKGGNEGEIKKNNGGLCIVRCAVCGVRCSKGRNDVSQ